MKPRWRLQTTAPAVLPSLLQCDFGNLRGEIERLETAGARALHLDVMDGHFVPNLSYGLPLVAAMRGMTRLPLDVHLMISNPEDYVERYVEAGADALSIHVEAVSAPHALLQRIRGLGVAAGLAFNPGTPVGRVEPFLDSCDIVLVMSVEPGFGGQKFQAVALDKLRTLRALAPRVVLEIDGGVGPENIAACAASGADFFVVGSAIFKTPDYAATLRVLDSAMAEGRLSRGASEAAGQ